MNTYPSVSQHAPEVAGFACLDTGRRSRTGAPEAVFAAGKTPDQTLALLAALRADDPATPALATRCPDEVLRRAPGCFPGERVDVDPAARTVVVGEPPRPAGEVLVVTAGTSDLPVAGECLATLRVLGVGTRQVTDVGIAGLGRLLARLPELRAADCLVVVAGMEGTLPGVVAGLVSAPVVALPTSVGYGVSAGGLVAAAAMLASCSPGLAVVNIDNGFGAAVHAARIIGVRNRTGDRHDS
ncbi:nickel pincer cofactor biosynthesis protein LarB [Streptomyces sp. NBC_01262]|uniref:nickel pincer cofactor biosynthesis protein LarB n=1 Tax=Streptomyces sp. NBC_01262 TaxID=2903803 RepID=UPI002E2F11DA|nr:nickel pincer cofactor biosynthesis protein LarB [Streptomyces sp. NBC_01262]